METLAWQDPDSAVFLRSIALMGPGSARDAVVLVYITRFFLIVQGSRLCG